jgi:hypothetical protein
MDRKKVGREREKLSQAGNNKRVNALVLSKASFDRARCFSKLVSSAKSNGELSHANIFFAPTSLARRRVSISTVIFSKNDPLWLEIEYTGSDTLYSLKQS